MKLKRKDRVVILAKNLRAEVVGYYRDTEKVKVITDAGHEWLIDRDKLRKESNTQEKE